jgi:CNT family concentrative nucleoside transporter
MSVARGAFGIVVILAICLLLSRNRRAVSYRIVLGGLLVQIVLGLVVFKTAAGEQALRSLTTAFTRVLEFSYVGSGFVFGPLGTKGDDPNAFVLAFQILPIVIFFAALMAVFYHFRIMQIGVYVVARLLSSLLKISGAESMVVTANVFVGMTEAPLVVRPYLERMTQSELMALMTGGFATVAGTLFAVYVSLVGEAYGPFLLAASVMSAPAAFVVAKVIEPEVGTPATGSAFKLDLTRPYPNVLAAISQGTSDGLRLALNIGAMLIAFYSLIALVNWPLEAWFGTSLQEIFGVLLRPLAWCLGVSWEDAGHVGSLLGLKVSTNEFFAYASLNQMVAEQAISDRSIKITTFALCGFANFGSIGVALGGLGQLIPGRRDDLSRMALRAMVGGALASFLTATIASAFF